jgi:3-oxoadipate enol-lactonase
MSVVKVNDINIYYETHGEGEPLILITGLNADITSWAFQTHEFAQKYKVTVFDNRGVGQTDTPDIPYSSEMMADDTAGLLQALDIPEAHIMGYSLGSSHPRMAILPNYGVREKF